MRHLYGSGSHQAEEWFQAMFSEAVWVVIALLLISPTTIDGVRQYGFSKESTNARRIFTGMLAGAGLFILKTLQELFF